MAPTEAKAGPQAPALPDAPAGDFWNETQWKVLLALMEAVIVPIVAESEVTDKRAQKKIPDAEFKDVVSRIQSSVAVLPSRDSLTAFLADAPSDNPAYAIQVRRTISRLPAKTRKQLGDALQLMSTRLGAFLLTGYCTPVQQQPVHVREAILLSWFSSRLPSLRILAKSVAVLGRSTWLQTSPLFKQISGYPDSPPDWKATQGFEYSFVQFAAGSGDAGPAVVETDVVIVGSGCGGAVCAKNLAEAGHRVVVVDKGYYHPPAQLPMPQQEGACFMFENGGGVTSADASIIVTAGSTWGGGGAINWAVSLKTPDYVRQEWARNDGLGFFETQEFQDCLDRVCDVMGVTDQGVRQSHRGQVLLDGSKILGYDAAPLPQNCGGKDHWDGHCHLGCGSGQKLGTTVTWLPAAARAGASFIEGFQVNRVTFDSSAPNKRANGVVGKWVSKTSSSQGSVTREVVIKAKKVIVSCGSIWSPIILKKSGLNNPHIGKNLHLHPCNFVTAFYKEDVRPWEGGIITSYSTSFENLDGHGHGTKPEPMCMIPYLTLVQIPFQGGLNFKMTAARFRHMDAYISLTRDRDTGHVVPDPIDGKPSVHYTPSPFDRAHTLEGCIAIAKMCYVAGATEINVLLPGLEPFVRDPPGTETSATPAASATNGTGPKLAGREITDPAFNAWLNRVRKVSNAPPLTPFSSAHQMGTCRMSSTKERGVVDAAGKVWGVEDLYVADASVFPSASGVNPMVTNMAISDWISRGLVKEMAAKTAG